MLTLLLSLAAFGIYSRAAASQIPLNFKFPGSAVGGHDNVGSWNLDEVPSPASTTPLLFDSISSLMQLWQNTRYRNGHNIVPGAVPPGTLLYHGRFDGELPTEPDWTATDPEHSLMFAQRGGWHLTLAATRELKVLYFDGSSAAKMPDGEMDTQDIIAWGEVKPEKFFDEKERLRDLCEWGTKFGLDGFLRMEMDFEIMLCDFKAGLEVVSFVKLESQWKREGPFVTPPSSSPPISEHSVHMTRPTHATRIQAQEVPHSLYSIQSLISGSWHNHYPGETRIQLDYSRLISFYDTSLVPSLVASRAKENVTRFEHRLLDINKDEAHSVRRKLETLLRINDSKRRKGGNVDWRTLFHVVVERFAGRLEDLEFILNDSTMPPDEIVRRTSDHLRIMLSPYIVQSASSPPQSISINSVPMKTHHNHSWAEPVYKLCTETHTKFIGYKSELTESEELMKKTIRDTEREICRVLVRMWAVWKEEAKVVSDAEEETVLLEQNAGDLTKGWKNDVGELMKWLDWGVWAKCKPACKYEEICYMPTWPWSSPRRRRPHVHEDEAYPLRQAYEHNLLPQGDDGDEDEWDRPQPRCVSRIDPF